MSELIFSSAVLTMSQTTEFIRNKSVDITIINLIIQNRTTVFTVDEAYEKIHKDLPIRKEDIEKSFHRSVESKTLELIHKESRNFSKAKFRIPDFILKKVDEQCEQLKKFLDESVNELFKGLVNKENIELYKDLLLDVLTKMMAKYGYAYAGQLVGIGEATEFFPLKDLKSICSESIDHYKLKVTTDELTASIGHLFDRRDPCLNNLAFSICNRYYITRLLGLDIPIDFIAKNLYEGATIFLDTNLIMTILYARSNRHNEFREIIHRAESTGITFSVSEITLAELHERVQDYTEDLEKGSEILPDDLLTEVRGDIVEKNESSSSNIHFDPETSTHRKRLEEIGVKFSPLMKSSDLFEKEEYDIIESQIAVFDRKYRRVCPAKNKNALFHDSYMYFLIKKMRQEGEQTSAWFLTLDNSMIEHGIATKLDDALPYSIRLFSLLQTLSQFVESQALKGEFADLFGELVSKDLLPRNQLFTIEDMKLLIGFDIRAKEIPPEFVRKAMLHVKKNILKGGEINDKNRSEAIHEFTKFLATPEHNFIEIRKKYDKKIQDRDEDIKNKDGEINSYKQLIQVKESEISNLTERLQQIELNQSKEKWGRATDKHNNEKKSFVEKELQNLLREQKSLRNRYILFFIIALIFFSIVFFFNKISSWLTLSLVIADWLRYSLSILVFVFPFLRSFYEHKKVLGAFKMRNQSFRTKFLHVLKTELEKEYDSIHIPPKLENFIDNI